MRCPKNSTPASGSSANLSGECFMTGMMDRCIAFGSAILRSVLSIATGNAQSVWFGHLTTERTSEMYYLDDNHQIRFFGKYSSTRSDVKFQRTPWKAQMLQARMNGQGFWRETIQDRKWEKMPVAAELLNHRLQLMAVYGTPKVPRNTQTVYTPKVA